MILSTTSVINAIIEIMILIQNDPRSLMGSPEEGFCDAEHNKYDLRNNKYNENYENEWSTKDAGAREWDQHVSAIAQ